MDDKAKTEPNDDKKQEEIKAKAADSAESEDESLTLRLARLPFGLTKEALRMAGKAGTASFKVGRAMLQPERLEMMAEAGRSLRDMREVAGLTLMELAEAIDLEDKSLLEAVERGTATLSFDLILRLAAVLARHDPVPFVMRLTRTYNPSIWKILNDWGVGRVSLQYERERQFINIFRRRDAARKLSDEGFDKVLEFTQSAFEMALHFIAEAEGVEDTVVEPPAEK
jgi:transcriptional regulator with XRE-family HTH domain